MKAFISALSLIFALAAFTSIWSLTGQPEHTQAVHMATVR
jgi:hypothetical protein